MTSVIFTKFLMTWKRNQNTIHDLFQSTWSYMNCCSVNLSVMIITFLIQPHPPWILHLAFPPTLPFTRTVFVKLLVLRNSDRSMVFSLYQIIGSEEFKLIHSFQSLSNYCFCSILIDQWFSVFIKALVLIIPIDQWFSVVIKLLVLIHSNWSMVDSLYQSIGSDPFQSINASRHLHRRKENTCFRLTIILCALLWYNNTLYHKCNLPS